jgi:hypothetical protein
MPERRPPARSVQWEVTVDMGAAPIDVEALDRALADLLLTLPPDAPDPTAPPATGQADDKEGGAR